MTVSSLSTSFYGAGVFTGMMCLPHITEWESLVFTSRLLTWAPDASVCPPCGPPPSLLTLLCLAVTTSGRAVFLLCWGCGRNSWWISPLQLRLLQASDCSKMIWLCYLYVCCYLRKSDPHALAWLRMGLLTCPSAPLTGSSSSQVQWTLSQLLARDALPSALLLPSAWNVGKALVLSLAVLGFFPLHHLPWLLWAGSGH